MTHDNKVNFGSFAGTNVFFKVYIIEYVLLFFPRDFIFQVYSPENRFSLFQF